MTVDTDRPTTTRPARRWLRWLPVVLVLVVATVIAVWPRGSAGPPAAAVGAPPPVDLGAARAKAALPNCVPSGATPAAGSVLAGVRVTCLATGAAVDLGSLLAGAPALVNVWADWCGPCQHELPALADYAAGPGAIRVLGVQVQGDPKNGLDLLSSLGVHLPMVYDGTAGPAARALRLPDTLPATYLVRPDGTLTRITDPLVFDSVDQVRTAVAKYLGTGSPGTGGSGH